MNDATFKTSDRDLALALATAGCIPEPMESGGPAINLYTPDLLRNWGYIRGAVSVKEFEAVVTTCTTGGILPDGRRIRRRLGIVIFSFIRDETFNRAHGAWDACANEIVKAQNENREPKLADLSPEAIMQAAHGMRMNVERLNKLGWVRTPQCAIGGFSGHEEPIPSKNVIDGKMSHQGVTKTVAKGHMKQWTLGCSQKMRDDLKLDKK